MSYLGHLAVAWVRILLPALGKIHEERSSLDERTASTSDGSSRDATPD